MLLFLCQVLCQQAVSVSVCVTLCVCVSLCHSLCLCQSVSVSVHVDLQAGDGHEDGEAVAEMRARLLAGLKRYLHGKRLNGLLSSQVIFLCQCRRCRSSIGLWRIGGLLYAAVCLPSERLIQKYRDAEGL